MHLSPAEWADPGKAARYVWTLARAHASSGDGIAIASYLGAGDPFDQAIAAFSEAYADQNERDYNLLLEGVNSGRLAAATGP